MAYSLFCNVTGIRYKRVPFVLFLSVLDIEYDVTFVVGICVCCLSFVVDVLLSLFLPYRGLAPWSVVLCRCPHSLHPDV